MDYTVEQRVINVILRSQNVLTGEITVDCTLNELGIDSVDGINLLYDLEEEFKINLPYDVKHLTSVRDIISTIQILIIEQSSIHTNKTEIVEEI